MPWPSVASVLIVILCPLNKHTHSLYPRESQPKRHSLHTGQRQLNANFSSTPLCPLESLTRTEEREGRDGDGEPEENQDKPKNKSKKTKTGNFVNPSSE